MNRLNDQNATCRQLGISRSALQHLFNKGQLRYVLIGTKKLVPDTEIERFISERLESPVDPVPLASA